MGCWGTASPGPRLLTEALYYCKRGCCLPWLAAVGTGHPTNTSTGRGPLPTRVALRRLFLHRVFWSSKPPALELTVACGLNPSRLEALEAQCASWKGPLAAAVYLPVLRPAGDDATAQRSRGRVQQLEGDLEALVKR